MTEKDFKIVCTKIDEEREFLNAVSQDIWKMPELAFKEVHAHAVLTSALSKFGFPVEKHYFLTTAFRAEFCVKAGGPTVAIILEYDALPDIGHACGHNLIAEAGVAAAIAVKKAMEEDRSIAGKLVVLGTPAEEGGGGKIRLLELGAFEKIDVALMVHPTTQSIADTSTNSRIRCYVEYKGKEAHAAASPWEGRNALDAAVTCYNSISTLRQQMRPTNRIHGVKFDASSKNAGSTDMGNVSHVVPSLHPFYPLLSETGLHTPKFAEAARSPEAQEPTLTAAKALALTCLAIMRDKDALEEAKQKFHQDISEDLQPR